MPTKKNKRSKLSVKQVSNLSAVLQLDQHSHADLNLEAISQLSPGKYSISDENGGMLYIHIVKGEIQLNYSGVLALRLRGGSKVSSLAVTSSAQVSIADEFAAGEKLTINAKRIIVEQDLVGAKYVDLSAAETLLIVRPVSCAELLLKAKRVTCKNKITAQKVHLDAWSQANLSGKIVAEQLQIKSPTIYQKEAIFADTAKIESSKKWLNAGHLYAQHYLDIQADDFINRGHCFSAHTIKLKANHVRSEERSSIRAQAFVSIMAQSFSNSGQLLSDHNSFIKVGSWVNRGAVNLGQEFYVHAGSLHAHTNSQLLTSAIEGSPEKKPARFLKFDALFKLDPAANLELEAAHVVAQTCELSGLVQARQTCLDLDEVYLLDQAALHLESSRITAKDRLEIMPKAECTLKHSMLNSGVQVVDGKLSVEHGVVTNAERMEIATDSALVLIQSLLETAELNMPGSMEVRSNSCVKVRKKFWLHDTSALVVEDSQLGCQQDFKTHKAKVTIKRSSLEAAAINLSDHVLVEESLIESDKTVLSGSVVVQSCRLNAEQLIHFNTDEIEKLESVHISAGAIRLDSSVDLSDSKWDADHIRLEGEVKLRVQGAEINCQTMVQSKKGELSFVDSILTSEDLVSFGKMHATNSLVKAKSFKGSGKIILDKSMLESSSFIKTDDLTAKSSSITAGFATFSGAYDISKGELSSDFLVQAGKGKISDSKLKVVHHVMPAGSSTKIERSRLETLSSHLDGKVNALQTAMASRSLLQAEGLLSLKQSSLDIAHLAYSWNDSILSFDHSSAQLAQAKFSGRMDVTASAVKADYLHLEGPSTFSTGSQLSVSEALIYGPAKHVVTHSAVKARTIGVDGDLRISSTPAFAATDELRTGEGSKVQLEHAQIKAKALSSAGSLSMVDSTLSAESLTLLGHLTAKSSQLVVEDSGYILAEAQFDAEQSLLRAKKLNFAAKGKVKDLSLEVTEQADFVAGAKLHIEGECGLHLTGKAAVSIGSDASIEGDALKIAAKTIHSRGHVSVKKIAVDTEWLTINGYFGGEHINIEADRAVVLTPGARLTGNKTAITSAAVLGFGAHINGSDSLDIKTLFNANVGGVYSGFDVSVNSLASLNAGLILPSLPTSMEALKNPARWLRMGTMLASTVMPAYAGAINFASTAAPLLWSAGKAAFSGLYQAGKIVYDGKVVSTWNSAYEQTEKAYADAYAYGKGIWSGSKSLYEAMPKARDLVPMVLQAKGMWVTANQAYGSMKTAHEKYTDLTAPLTEPGAVLLPGETPKTKLSEYTREAREFVDKKISDLKTTAGNAYQSWRSGETSAADYMPTRVQASAAYEWTAQKFSDFQATAGNTYQAWQAGEISVTDFMPTGQQVLSAAYLPATCLGSSISDSSIFGANAGLMASMNVTRSDYFGLDAGVSYGMNNMHNSMYLDHYGYMGGYQTTATGSHLYTDGYIVAGDKLSLNFSEMIDADVHSYLQGAQTDLQTKALRAASKINLGEGIVKVDTFDQADTGAAHFNKTQVSVAKTTSVKGYAHFDHGARLQTAQLNVAEQANTEFHHQSVFDVTGSVENAGKLSLHEASRASIGKTLHTAASGTTLVEGMLPTADAETAANVSSIKAQTLQTDGVLSLSRAYAESECNQINGKLTATASTISNKELKIAEAGNASLAKQSLMQADQAVVAGELGLSGSTLQAKKSLVTTKTGRTDLRDGAYAEADHVRVQGQMDLAAAGLQARVHMAVANTGHLAATKGSAVQADGELENAGSLAVSASLLKAKKTLRTTATGTTVATDEAKLSAGQVDTSGKMRLNHAHLHTDDAIKIAKGGRLVAEAAASVVAKTILDAGELQVKESVLEVKDKLEVKAKGSATLERSAVTLANIDVDGELKLKELQIEQVKSLAIKKDGHLAMEDASASIDTLEIAGDLAATASSIKSKNLRVKRGGKARLKGKMHAGKDGRKTITLSTLEATSAQLEGALGLQAAQLKVEKDLSVCASGSLKATDSSEIDAKTIAVHGLTELEKSQMTAEKDLHLHAGSKTKLSDSVVKAATLCAAGTLKATDASEVDAKTIALHGQTELEKSRMTAEKDLHLHAGSKTKLSDSVVKAATLCAAGTLKATDASEVDAKTIALHGQTELEKSRMTAEKDLHLHAGSKTKLSDSVAKAATLTAAGKLNARAARLNVAGRATFSRGAELDTHDVEIKAKDIYHAAHHKFAGTLSLQAESSLTTVAGASDIHSETADKAAASVLVMKAAVGELGGKVKAKHGVVNIAGLKEASAYAQGTGRYAKQQFTESLDLTTDADLRLDNLGRDIDLTLSGKSIDLVGSFKHADRELTLKSTQGDILIRNDIDVSKLAVASAGNITNTGASKVKKTAAYQAEGTFTNLGGDIHAGEKLAIKAKSIGNVSRGSAEFAKFRSGEKGIRGAELAGRSTGSGSLTAATALLEATGGDIDNHGGLIAGSEYAQLRATGDVHNIANERSYRGTHDTHKEFTSAVIRGGRGREGDDKHVGLHISADGKVFNDASSISAVGTTYVKADKGLESTARSHTYVNDRHTESKTFLGVKYGEKTHETVVTDVHKAAISSEAGKVIIQAADGAVKVVATDITTKAGTIIDAKGPVELLSLKTLTKTYERETAWFGLTEDERKKQHEGSVLTEMADQSGISKIRSREGDVIAKGALFTGDADLYIKADKGSVKLASDTLENDECHKSREISVKVPAADMMKAASKGDVAGVASRLHPLGGAVSSAVEAKHPYEVAAAASNIGVHGYNTASAVAEAGIGAPLSQMVNGMTSVQVSMTQTETNTHFQTNGGGGIRRRNVHLEAAKDITMSGIAFEADNASFLAEEVNLLGKGLTSSVDTKQDTVTVNVSAVTGGIQDVSASHSESATRATRYAHQKLKVKGNTHIAAKKLTMDAAHLETGTITGEVTEMEVVTRQDEMTHSATNASASTTGMVSASATEMRSKTASQASGIHAHAGINHDAEHRFSVKKATLTGAMITTDSADTNHFTADKLETRDVHDFREGSTTGFSMNVASFADAAAGSEAATHSRDTVGMTLGKEDYKAVHRATVATAEGTQALRATEITGDLNRDASAAFNVEANEKYCARFDVPTAMIAQASKTTQELTSSVFAPSADSETSSTVQITELTEPELSEVFPGTATAADKDVKSDAKTATTKSDSVSRSGPDKAASIEKGKAEKVTAGTKTGAGVSKPKASSDREKVTQSSVGDETAAVKESKEVKAAKLAVETSRLRITKAKGESDAWYDDRGRRSNPKKAIFGPEKKKPEAGLSEPVASSKKQDDLPGSKAENAKFKMKKEVVLLKDTNESGDTRTVKFDPSKKRFVAEITGGPSISLASASGKTELGVLGETEFAVEALGAEAKYKLAGKMLDGKGSLDADLSVGVTLASGVVRKEAEVKMLGLKAKAGVELEAGVAYKATCGVGVSSNPARGKLIEAQLNLGLFAGPGARGKTTYSVEVDPEFVDAMNHQTQTLLREEPYIKELEAKIRAGHMPTPAESAALDSFGEEVIKRAEIYGRNETKGGPKI